MKLYAKITSERKSRAGNKGGDEYLKIELSAFGKIIGYIVLEVTEDSLYLPVQYLLKFSPHLPLPGRSLGGGVFDVFSATIHDHFLTVRARDESGDIHIITTPVEQIAFDIIISKKTSDEPPREIGFLRDKEIDEEIQKTPKTA
jgi:hypothetical protein